MDGQIESPERIFINPARMAIITHSSPFFFNPVILLFQGSSRTRPVVSRCALRLKQPTFCIGTLIFQPDKAKNWFRIKRSNRETVPCGCLRYRFF